MRIFLILLFLITLGFSGSLEWNRSYKASLEEAKKLQKPLLVYIRMPGCGTCRLMEEEVFPDNKVSTFMRTHYVIVKVYGNDDELPKDLQMKMAPVFHFIDPRNNNVIDTLIGGKRAGAFLETLEDKLSEYKHPEKD